MNRPIEFVHQPLPLSRQTHLMAADSLSKACALYALGER